MDVWRGDIELPGSGAIQNVELVAARGPAPSLDCISLRFLAVVDVARIPLYLAVGPSLDVYSQSDATQEWFSALLLGGHVPEKDAEPWWQQTSTAQSPIGILIEIHQGPNSTSSPAITEILFYAAISDVSANPTSSPTDATTAVTIKALPLSSDLLHKLPAVTTPPLSPQLPVPSDSDPLSITAEFLPPLFPDPNETHHQHTRKRQSVSSLFDEATERRKRARRKGGEGISAAAASASASAKLITAPPSLPLQHRRSVSDVLDPAKSAAGSRPGSSEGRPLSRSPSLSGDAIIGRKAATEGGKRSASGLSRMTSVTEGSAAGEAEGQQTVELRNKDVISRLVMAGMRMYGLQQRKKTGRKGSMAGAEEVVTPEDAAKDEEYKLVYHQAYRGTVFAMRNHIGSALLTLHMEQLRETVDKLLAIFCTDPLVAPLPVEHSSAAVTPAGKQPFGTPTAGTEGSPFGQRGDSFGTAIGLGGRKVHTPVIRRQGG